MKKITVLNKESCEVSEGTHRPLITRSSYPCSHDGKTSYSAVLKEEEAKESGGIHTCDFLPDDMNNVLLHISCYLHSSHFLSALADICNSRQR